MVHPEVQKLNLNLSESRSSEVEQWCMKYIGPRLYYLHNKRGGSGWKLERVKRSTGYYGWCLEVEDEKQLLMAILKFGDS